ncbi:MAG: hypothetical protein Q7R62_02385 [bacterium]|nr:hypothetical protein [bacterium]
MKLKRILFLAAFVVLVAALGMAYVQLAEHDALLILHFDGYRGIDFLGSKFDVFNIIFLGIGITILNYLLARGIYRRSAVLAQIIAGATVFFSLLIFIAVAVIISVN